MLREIDVDLTNVTDAESMASALNASLNGVGVTATSDGTDVTFGGCIAKVDINCCL